MELEDVLNNAMASRRANQMKESDQLMLGELVLKLEAVDDLDKEAVFDDTDIRPSSVGSWRGSYAELAIRYQDKEGDGDTIAAREVLGWLRDANGSEFTGWKGGEYKMARSTPVWVANRGSSSGFEYHYQGVVDVNETDDAVVIETGEVPF